MQPIKPASWTYAESFVAEDEILGAKLGTVRSRIHRGRSMLRKALAHREPAVGRVRYRGAVS